MARGVKSEAQHLLMFSNSVLSVVFKKLSSCPAQAAAALSSVVALDRTATNSASRFRKDLCTSSTTSFGKSAPSIKDWILAEAFSTAGSSLWSTARKTEAISTFRSGSSKNMSKAVERTTKPGGTGMPACVISPREAPLPPAKTVSRLFRSLRFLTTSIIVHLQRQMEQRLSWVERD